MSVSCGFGAAGAGAAAGNASTLVYLADVDNTNVRVGAICYAGIKVDNNGSLYTRTPTGSYTLQYAWLLSGVVGDYQVRCTVNSGTVVGTTGTWQLCSTDRGWYISQSSNGTKTANITIEIRDTATSTVQASSTHALSAEYQTL